MNIATIMDHMHLVPKAINIAKFLYKRISKKIQTAKLKAQSNKSTEPNNSNKSNKLSFLKRLILGFFGIFALCRLLIVSSIAIYKTSKQVRKKQIVLITTDTE